MAPVRSWLTKQPVWVRCCQLAPVEPSSNCGFATASSCNTLSDTVNFAGVSEVDVEKDITVQAGTNGDASLSIVGTQFSEGAPTPEPGTLSMLGVGVLTLGGLMRRKLNL